MVLFSCANKNCQKLYLIQSENLAFHPFLYWNQSVDLNCAGDLINWVRNFSAFDNEWEIRDSKMPCRVALLNGPPVVIWILVSSCIFLFLPQVDLVRKMEVVVASVDDIKFDIELQLEQQYGAAPLPFPGMDSKFWH